MNILIVYNDGHRERKHVSSTFLDLEWSEVLMVIILDNLDD